MRAETSLASSCVAFASNGTITVLLAPDSDRLKVPDTSTELSSALNVRLRKWPESRAREGGGVVKVLLGTAWSVVAYVHEHDMLFEGDRANKT